MASYFILEFEALWAGDGETPNQFILPSGIEPAEAFGLPIVSAPYPAPPEEQPPEPDRSGPLANPFRERPRRHPGARQIRARGGTRVRSAYHQTHTTGLATRVRWTSTTSISRVDPPPAPPRPRPTPPEPEHRTIVVRTPVRVRTRWQSSMPFDARWETRLRVTTRTRIERDDGEGDILAMILAGVL